MVRKIHKMCHCEQCFIKSVVVLWFIYFARGELGFGLGPDSSRTQKLEVGSESESVQCERVLHSTM